LNIKHIRRRDKMAKTQFLHASKSLPLYKIMTDRKHGMMQSLETHNSRVTALKEVQY